MNYELEMKRYEVEGAENWRDWMRKIPPLKFKEEWNVKIIPPFGGAMARFCIDYNGRYVSVYLDVMSRLGWMVDDNDEPIPYWELYAPDAADKDEKFDDVNRYYLNETDELMKDIEIALS